MPMMRGHRLKFNNSVTTVAGHSYRSKLEASYARHLQELIKAGEVEEYTHEPIFRLDVNGKLICKIIPDFLVITKSGREEIHETKCWATQTPVWRVKWKLMQALYPEYKYKVVTKKDF